MAIAAAATAMVASVASSVVFLSDASAALADTIQRIDGVGYPGGGTTYSLDVEVFDEVTIGNTVFVAGKFTKIWDSKRGSWVDQRYLAAFDGTTGRYLPWFRPRIEAPVYAIEALGDKLLIGGEFRTVNGMADTNALALIDPTTAEVVPGWIGTPSNVNARAKVQDISILGQAVYIAGNFRTIVGGTPGSAVTVNGYTGIARLARSDGRPDPAFRPRSIGPVWTIAPSADGQRVHIGGNFDSVSGVGPTLATVSAADGSAVAGWDNSRPSSWTNVVGNMAVWRGLGWAIFDLAVYGDMLWIGGAEHGYAAKRSSTGQTVINRSLRHDSQRVEVIDGKVYIGCHCKAYSTGDTVRDLPMFELDAATGAQTSTFSRYLEGADGGWAITKTPDGCVWPGGDFRAGRDSAGNRVWVPGFTKVCDVGGPQPHTVAGVANRTGDDTAPPTTPSGLRVSVAGGSPVLSWGASTDDRSQVAYRIYRDGQLVGYTRRLSFTDSVSASERHTWVVTAVDGQGKVSTPTAPVALNGGTTTTSNVTAPTEAAPLARYENRVAFQLTAPASNVAYIEAAKDGTVVDRYYSDEVEPINNVAVNKTARMSSIYGVGDPATLVDGLCCSQANLSTQAQRDPWIEVDLGRSYDVEGIDRMLNGLGGGRANTYFMLRETPFTESDPVTAAAAPGTTSVVGTLAPASHMEQLIARARYARIWVRCDSCSLPATEMRVWGGNVKAPLSVSVPGGVGTYTFRSVGIDGTKSAPLTYTVTSATPFVTGVWNSLIDISARQSSTYPNGEAYRAVDGGTNGAFSSGTVAATGTPQVRNLATEPGVSATSLSVSSGGVPSRAIDANTSGLYAAASTFYSQPGTGSADNLLRAAGVSVSQSSTVNGADAGRAVDSNRDGSDAAASTAIAAPPGGAAPTSVNWVRQAGTVVSQSSDFAADTKAPAAVDGNSVTGPGTYAYTARGSAGWYRIDLGAERSVNDIQLWPRTDEKWWFGARMQVFISSVPFSGTTAAQLQATPGVTSFTVSSTPRQGQRFPVGRTARYLHFMRTEADSFAMTEIAVNGTPASSGNAYWQADLGQSTALSGLSLWPRTGCCASESANVRVLFSANPFVSADLAQATAQAGVTSVDIDQITSQTAVTAPATARYIRIQKKDAENLSLAEVEARGPTVRQWWGLDLGSVKGVDSLRIYPRTDACCAAQSANYWVFASDTPFSGDSAEAAMSKPGVIVNSVAASQVASVAINADVRYVRIQQQGPSALALAEVQVLAGGQKAWWEADLGAVRDLRSLRIYPRTECCPDDLANFRIMYSDTPIASYDPAVAITQAGVTYRDVTGRATVGQYVSVERRARYVRIQRLDGGPLTIAEIRMTGRLP